MTTAVEIVEKLLEADAPLQEADPTPAYAPDRSPLRVFGNDAPPKGWFYAGPDPLGEFIKYKRGPQVNLTSPQDRQNYIDYFVRNGYLLVFKQGNVLNIFGRENLHIPQDGVQAMEMTMGLTPKSQVNWGGRTIPAAVAIYGQPHRQKQPKGQAAVAPKVGRAAKSEQRTLIKGMFGGGYGDGSFSTGMTVDVPLMKKLLPQGHAFVIKYLSGSYNVIIPERYQFTPGAIKSMESRMGLTRNAQVQWFIGEINPKEAIQTTAAEAIYGDTV